MEWLRTYYFLDYSVVILISLRKTFQTHRRRLNHQRIQMNPFLVFANTLFINRCILELYTFINSLVVGKNPVPFLGIKPINLIQLMFFTLLILQLSNSHFFPEAPWRWSPCDVFRDIYFYDLRCRHIPKHLLLTEASAFNRTIAKDKNYQEHTWHEEYRPHVYTRKGSLLLRN